MYPKISRILITVILSVIFIAQPAAAQEDVPPQYDGKIVATNGEIYYVDVFEKVGKSNFPANVLKAHEALAAGGCKSLTNGVNFYNNLNQLVWRYSQKVNWCYDGTYITSLSHTKTATVYNSTWSYLGLVGHLHNGTVGWRDYRAYSVARFYCVCVANVYPWVDQAVYGNGGYSGQAGY